MNCFDCENPLLSLKGAHAPQIEIDICEDGHGAWFDVGEVEAYFKNQKSPLGFEQLIKNGVELNQDGNFPEHYKGKGCYRCWRILNWIKISKEPQHRNLMVGICYLHGIWLPQNLLERFPISEEDIEDALKQNTKWFNWFSFKKKTPYEDKPSDMYLESDTPLPKVTRLPKVTGKEKNENLKAERNKEISQEKSRERRKIKRRHKKKYRNQWDGVGTEILLQLAMTLFHIITTDD